MGDMIQRAAIENIGHYLARAVKDGNDIEAREHVAYANTMSGYSMVVTSCISEHSMEHAMSAYHPELPHGAHPSRRDQGILDLHRRRKT